MSREADLGDGSLKRSRREILAGAMGAMGTLIATTLAKASPAYAGVDGDVVLGVDNQSTSGRTGVLSANQFALHAKSSDVQGVGVWGEGSYTGAQGFGGRWGVVGGATDNQPGGAGVEGVAYAGGVGVHGTLNGSGTGVHGETPDVNGYGVFGENTGRGVGVLGQSDSSGRSAVWGDNLGGGPGVSGSSAAGAGVLGRSDPASGVGVSGHSVNGTGVWATAESSSATALKVSGRAVFSESGVLTIPSGATSAKVKVAGLTPASLVLATMQNKTGRVMVQAAVPDPAKGKFTVYLNEAPASPTTATVAWFVVN